MKLKKLRRVHAQKASLNPVFDFERLTKQTTLPPERKTADNNKSFLDDKSTVRKYQIPGKYLFWSLYFNEVTSFLYLHSKETLVQVFFCEFYQKF